MEIISGPGGLECLHLSHGSGASLLIARYGGHILSWKTAEGRERFFLSERTVYAPGKAIRGGVPVIFPQFSDHGPYPRHGFARRMTWSLVEGVDPDAALLELTDSAATLAEWPYPFRLRLGAELSATELTLRLSLENTGPQAMPFHAALHGYLALAEVTATRIAGLAGRDFHNEVTKQRELDSDAAITLGREVDRAYCGAGGSRIGFHNGDAEGSLEIEAEGFPDLVVWNPGPDHGLGDLTPDGWRAFVCVEAARIEGAEPLPAGATWTGTQTFRSGG